MMIDLPDTDLSPRRKRLIFRSDHRGTKEMDLLLGSFARKHIATMDEALVDRFEVLLELSDPDLYNWITGQEPTPPEWDDALMDMLKAHRYG